MLPQIFFFFLRCSEIDSEAFWRYVLVVSSKREAYTARLSFIWVVKERGGGRGGGGGGVEESWCLELVFTDRGFPQASPPPFK